MNAIDNATGTEMAADEMSVRARIEAHLEQLEDIANSTIAVLFTIMDDRNNEHNTEDRVYAGATILDHVAAMHDGVFDGLDADDLPEGDDEE